MARNNNNIKVLESIEIKIDFYKKLKGKTEQLFLDDKMTEEDYNTNNARIELELYLLNKEYDDYGENDLPTITSITPEELKQLKESVEVLHKRVQSAENASEVMGLITDAANTLKKVYPIKTPFGASFAQDENKYTVSYKTGWVPDLPHIGDYDLKSDRVSLRHKSLGQTRSVKNMYDELLSRNKSKLQSPIPHSVDLRPWCSPIEHQGQLNSCTAQAGVALLEYFERRAFGRHIDASRLFLYKATRNLLHWTGDNGAYLRTTMQAMVLFGVPPEEYWPYSISEYNVEPSSFCYSFAQNYQAILYYRLDTPNTAPKELLGQIKELLQIGCPSMLGFTVFGSISQAEKNGCIPFPGESEEQKGGHAVVAVGYHDNIKIPTLTKEGATIENGSTEGAFLIRNSWGTGWGDKGYGWLPYEYVLRELAVDWWSLLKNEWVDSKKFG